MSEPVPASAGDLARTVGVLALLQLALPANLAVTGAALLRGLLAGSRRPDPATAPRTVLISGGKMTKALQLARCFHAVGHRVILVESGAYRFCGARYSRSVDRFVTVPLPQDDGYCAALLDLVVTEGVDVYVPVCSPAASLHDARAKAALSAHCEVLHCDPDVVATLDDKERFAALADFLDLRVPESHRVTDPDQVADFDGADGRPFILKSIAYDPVHRLDLTPLPRPTRALTRAFAAARPLTTDNPWVLQEFVAGREYCTHTTARRGRVQVYCCCPSSAFQVNYTAVDKPEIEAWVTRFVAALGLTGQVSFDFIESADGRVYAIECNPRTHSAITVFDGHPELAAAYLDDGHPIIRPLPGATPTYWTYHELWRILSRPSRARERLRVLAQGRDAVFDWSDPLPFLMLHHAQIPWLLVQSLRRRRGWIRIDFNIGKLVQAAGD